MISIKTAFLAIFFLFACLPSGKSRLSLPVSSLLAEAAYAPDAWKKDMLNKVNALRSKGCRCGRRFMPPAPALRWNDELEKSAMGHAADMYRNNFMDHTGSNGSSIGKRATKAGYEWSSLAENVAWGQQSVDEVMQSWTESPGHCVNIMSKSYRDFAAARQGVFWVQEFGRNE